MAFNTEVANLALSHLGIGKLISDIETEQSAEAKACRTFYDIVFKTVLRDYPWPFATRFKALALVEENPNDEWDFSYKYPTDCLFARRIVGVNRNPAADEKIPFRVVSSEEGTLIYTDVDQAVLEYTINIDDNTLMTADFVMAFSYKLASVIAPIITSGDPMKVGAAAKQSYFEELSNAKANAFNEEQPDIAPESEFTRTRL